MTFFFPLCIFSLPFCIFSFQHFAVSDFYLHFISLLAHDLPRNNAGCTCHNGLPVDRIRLCWCLSVWLPLQRLPLLWWLRWRLLSICRPHHHPRMFYLCICVSVRVLHSSHRIDCFVRRREEIEGTSLSILPLAAIVLLISFCDVLLCCPPSSFMQ